MWVILNWAFLAPRVAVVGAKLALKVIVAPGAIDVSPGKSCEKSASSVPVTSTAVIIRAAPPVFSIANSTGLLLLPFATLPNGYGPLPE